MNTARRGQSFIEIILAVALMVIGIAASASITTATLKAAEQTDREARAIAIAEEGIEATISIRDRVWLELVDGNHGLAINNSPKKWVFSGSSDVTDSTFTRVVTISSIGLDTKKVTSTVTWSPEPGRTATVQFVALVTIWPFV